MFQVSHTRQKVSLNANSEDYGLLEIETYNNKSIIINQKFKSYK